MFDEYIGSMPSPQNAVNLVPGWNHALPPEAGAIAGDIALYRDERIEWSLEQFGSIAGARILELGPLEGAHTYMLNAHNPALIDAIEANKLSYLRCLIAKELLRLDRAHFKLGDFQKWLEFSPARYDLIIASGVLYHMADPVRLLELMSWRANALFIWTHYFSETAMPLGDSRRGAFSGEVTERPFRGMSVELYKRSYHGAWKDKAFCGGMFDDHSWMKQDALLSVLRSLGYDDIRVAQDMPDHPRGPCISIFARRSRGEV